MPLICFSFNLANSDDNTNGKETSLKELVLPCSEQKANASNLASQFKKENDQRDSTADSLVPPPQEQPEYLVFANGIAQTNHLMDYQENNLSDGTVPLHRTLTLNLPQKNHTTKAVQTVKRKMTQKGLRKGKSLSWGLVFLRKQRWTITNTT